MSNDYGRASKVQVRQLGRYFWKTLYKEENVATAFTCVSFITCTEHGYWAKNKLTVLRKQKTRDYETGTRAETQTVQFIKPDNDPGDSRLSSETSNQGIFNSTDGN